MARACSSSIYVNGLRLTDLKFATAFSIWSFRALATGHHHCPPVLKGFERAFGAGWECAHQAMLDFVHSIDTTGRRTLKLSTAGCLGVTHDEMSIVSVLYAAQDNNDDEVTAHLYWLLGRSETGNTSEAAMTLARIFHEKDLKITPIEPVSQQAVGTTRPQNHASVKGERNVRTLH